MAMLLKRNFDADKHCIIT